jgi:hypothetical protein
MPGAAATCLPAPQETGLGVEGEEGGVMPWRTILTARF